MIITLAGVICVLIFRFCLNWLRISSEIDLIVYDVNTTSVTDFSVQVELPEEIWDSWKKHKKSIGNSEMTFKDYFKKQFEAQI